MKVVVFPRISAGTSQEILYKSPWINYCFHRSLEVSLLLAIMVGKLKKGKIMLT